MLPRQERRLKIAVVGSGIAGLSAAWLLDQAHEVTLFEKQARLGGHTHTHHLDLPEGNVAVDTGFIVYNPVNYPNLVELFKHLDVSTQATDMSFGVALHTKEHKLEYSGCGLGGWFAQRQNLWRWQHWHLLKEILRFYQHTEILIQEAQQQAYTLEEMLTKHGYSRAFIEQHLIPMGAAIWSTPADKMLQYPALAFLRFCRNHGLVQLKDRPQWRTLCGGSHTYVEKIAASLNGRIQLNAHLRKVHRHQGKVIVQHQDGLTEVFDHLVLACHADQALALLAQPSKQEQDLLGVFSYQKNLAYLHQDTRFMPEEKRAWASWNYLSHPQQQQKQVSVTYWMNRLQHLSTNKPLLVTLNPVHPPKASHILRSVLYEHPVFSLQSMHAQQALWSLQGQANAWFCGAYFGYGFHEDGLQAGLAVAEALGGVQRPWRLTQPNSRIFVPDAAASADHVPWPQAS
ncbi:hypothetical protein SAMN05421831_101252 [Allopseudospirillum japonicum]|uniref:Amine oxidase domain-containing protein n=1 Tax=Allopseudospirillum japonicum TaxID=64971 RepID=A0A1H6QF40_9GAMM|nr:FAD-dependent oxidoreductase [Allopseudospirillum japonicum]SEI39564.1 hypothetical protein SAMN05421831_101252 [Allopseudospirillum japonicum]